jgi:hypothetical protein
MTLIWDLCGVSLRKIGVIFDGGDYAAVAQQMRRTQDRGKEKRPAASLTKLNEKCQRNLDLTPYLATISYYFALWASRSGSFQCAANRLTNRSS